MRCPFCKVDDDKVIDSRASSDGFAIRRRRECVDCGRRFTTYERIEESPLRVIKKEGVREPFERRKILFGLIKACEKRPIPLADLEEITERIEGRILEKYESEVPVSFIGELVMDELKALDKVAYVRFASVYREFKDINEFMDELKSMLSGPGGTKSRPGAKSLSGGKRAARKGATPQSGTSKTKAKTPSNAQEPRAGGGASKGSTSKGSGPKGSGPKGTGPRGTRPKSGGSSRS